MKYYRFENQIYEIDFDKKEATEYTIYYHRFSYPYYKIIKPNDFETIEDLVKTWINLCEPDFIEISEEEFNTLYNEWLQLYNEWQNFTLRFQVKVNQYESNFESKSDD